MFPEYLVRRLRHAFYELKKALGMASCCIKFHQHVHNTKMATLYLVLPMKKLHKQADLPVATIEFFEDKFPNKNKAVIRVLKTLENG